MVAKRKSDSWRHKASKTSEESFPVWLPVIFFFFLKMDIFIWKHSYIMHLLWLGNICTFDSFALLWNWLCTALCLLDVFLPICINRKLTWVVILHEYLQKEISVLEERLHINFQMEIYLISSQKVPCSPVLFPVCSVCSPAFLNTASRKLLTMVKWS